jgi:hypothetical protein
MWFFPNKLGGGGGVDVFFKNKFTSSLIERTLRRGTTMDVRRSSQRIEEKNMRSARLKRENYKNTSSNALRVIADYQIVQFPIDLLLAESALTSN